jgi:hypothetical protein
MYLLISQQTGCNNNTIFVMPYYWAYKDAVILMSDGTNKSFYCHGGYEALYLPVSIRACIHSYILVHTTAVTTVLLHQGSATIRRPFLCYYLLATMLYNY